MASKPAHKKLNAGQHSWLNKLIALIVTINFVLVGFNLTYVHLRNFYVDFAPSLVQLYDPIKTIEPHAETQNYLKQVNELEEQVRQDEVLPETVARSLQNVQMLSLQIIEDNPFDMANKSSILEKIKHKMRERTGNASAREAFATFWSQEYLVAAGWEEELTFFDTQIRPLIETNYYRDINQYGQFKDNFWSIDIPFIIFFGLEFLIRTFSLSRRKPELSWLQAILRRWYDLFLLLPFWRWLRIIPVTVRLYQSNLLNLEPVREQINYDFAGNFAEELTEIVGIQAIDQLQNSIRRGELARWLFHPETRRPYVQVNQTNEVKAITTRLINLSVYKVFPKIKPEIEALVHHSLKKTLDQTAAFQQIQNLPGLSHLPAQVSDRLAKTLSETVYSNLVKALEDPIGAELTGALLENFRDALEEELQKPHNVQEIQSWLIDLLEEIKINYVKNIAEADLEETLEEAARLHRSIYPIVRKT
ncbi:hypothetical protein [Microcoleus sp. FACHB-68]|uniref:hypothetical protein n=1 Tax=Microcoleus sp. FACHB-68 TaxID=2692826 RepID=UPI0016834AF7|nr:hypothetical protein [Microcoleus sp. FACHB-68]MBD1937034.1 hypothetical protein [Microcoleus sp. FACHB-68]